MFRKKDKFDDLMHLPRIYEDKYEYTEDYRAMVNYVADTYDKANAFILKDKKEGEVKYIYKTFRDFASDVKAMSAYLVANGFLDNPVALVGKNCYQWVIAYFATLYAGGIMVPLDKMLPTGEAISLYERSYSKSLIYHSEQKDIYRAIVEAKGEEQIKGLDMDSLQSCIDKGNELIEQGMVEHEEREIDVNKMALLLFTSGTTSASKAVMLSQANVMADCYDAITTEDIRFGDVNMALLPYHHTFGGMGQVVMLLAGVTTTYCDGLKYLQKNLVEYNITMFVGVPLLVESIYKKIMSGIRKRGKEKTFKRVVALSNVLLKLGIDKRRKFFKAIIDQIGGLRFIIVGASPVDPDVVIGLKNIGITCVQGYGLTESSPIISAESKERNRRGSVGKAMPCVDVKIINPDEEGVGELIAKGSNIMLGYFENEEATNKALVDGWLHTGDLAYIDEDGYIYIKGREKNVIVLKNGKNIYPEEIEKLIEGLPFVNEVMVYGEDKNKDDAPGTNLTVACKIVYNKDYMQEAFNVKDEAEIYGIINSEIDKINKEMPEYKHVKRVNITETPMSKTSTGKIKRYEEMKK